MGGGATWLLVSVVTVDLVVVWVCACPESGARSGVIGADLS